MNGTVNCKTQLNDLSFQEPCLRKASANPPRCFGNIENRRKRLGGAGFIMFKHKWAARLSGPHSQQLWLTAFACLAGGSASNLTPSSHTTSPPVHHHPPLLRPLESSDLGPLPMIDTRTLCGQLSISKKRNCSSFAVAGSDAAYCSPNLPQMLGFSVTKKLRRPLSACLERWGAVECTKRA
jgi:hypothetical protein